jgi:hypothetical protein
MVPSNGWFRMENTIEIGDDWGVPLFQETSGRNGIEMGVELEKTKKLK